jgi:hypothetical protein
MTDLERALEKTIVHRAETELNRALSLRGRLVKAEELL